jgi:hypothetical protein
VLAGVYEWLMRDEMLTPQGSVAAYAGVVGELRPDARVLDCSAGAGHLAVGLALKGRRRIGSGKALVYRARRDRRPV